MAGIIPLAGGGEGELITGEHEFFFPALPVIFFFEHDEAVGHAGQVGEPIGERLLVALRIVGEGNDDEKEIEPPCRAGDEREGEESRGRFGREMAHRYNATMVSARSIAVQLSGHRYEILVAAGLLGEVGPQLRKLSNSKKCALVVDPNVPHQPGLHASLMKADFAVIASEMPAGEENKTVAGASKIYDALLSAGIERTTPILAMGGGVVGDTVGFVAATMLRGVPLVQIPTTLLAMVDASVGGKTGVNHAVGKNLIGAFHQPIAVFVDPTILKSLPPRELRSGLAECIKHEVIRDGEGFSQLETNIGRALALDMEYLSELVAHNVAIKAKVVEADPFEKGERAHLNFGHTFGHAIETVSKYSYTHGECVALGMIAAARTAVWMNMLDEKSCWRIAKLVEKAGLPASGLKLPVDEVVGAMIFDKKVKAGKVRFVLPDRIGHVVIRDDVPENLVRRAIESLA